MIRQEEQLNRFSRRNRYYGFNYPEMAGKMAYPAGELTCKTLPATNSSNVCVRCCTSWQVDQGTIRTEERRDRYIHDPRYRQRHHWSEFNKSFLICGVLMIAFRPS